MNPHIEKLKKYLDSQPVNAVCNDAKSLMDLLCYIYMTESPLDSATLRFQFQKADQILERLSLEENDQLFYLTMQICDTYIRMAFQDGIHVGYHLMAELSDPS